MQVDRFMGLHSQKQREISVKTKVMLDPMDWTPNDIARHLRQDAVAFKRAIDNAIDDDYTDTLLLEIQNFYGKVKTWLELYEVVTKGTKE